MRTVKELQYTNQSTLKLQKKRVIKARLTFFHHFWTVRVVFFLELSIDMFISKSKRSGLLKIYRGFKTINLLCC